MEFLVKSEEKEKNLRIRINFNKLKILNFAFYAIVSVKIIQSKGYDIFKNKRTFSYK